jgi:predicted enzyme related to lactoylglutathione lyase
MATKQRPKKSRRPRAKPRPAGRAKTAARARRASTKPRSRAGKRPASKAKVARRAARPAMAPVVRSAIGITHQHMDYTSHVLDEVKRFYTELLGLGDFQYDPGFQYLSVRIGPSASLGFMPPMPGPPEQWRPPREPAIYLHVRDVDRAHRELAAKGVVFLQPPTDMPWKHRVAILRDPEGRTVMLAQIAR